MKKKFPATSKDKNDWIAFTKQMDNVSPKESDLPKENIPDTESLEDTYNRVVNYFIKNIEKKLHEKNNILISAHGNSLRALCKFLFKLDEIQITKLEIPTGNPLMITFGEKNKISKCRYLDQERAQDLLVF